jgi:2'-5' RNA ligase
MFFKGMGTRCFIAIECSNDEVIQGLRDVQSGLTATGGHLKHVEPDNLHLTLKFLGDVEKQIVDKVSEIISEISFNSFNMFVENVGVFPNLRRPSVIWAGVTEGAVEITRIFKEMDNKLGKLGLKRERRRFHPHITISRVRSGKNREKLLEELMRISDYRFGENKVEKIVLKKSVLTPRGPVYTTLAESVKPQDI